MRYLLSQSFVLLVVIIWCAGCSEPPKLHYIAHAGGGIHSSETREQKLTYTNSLEALNQNYKRGHRLFEIDFTWTNDNELIALHDWERSYVRLFEPPHGPLSLSRFLEARSKNGLTQMDLQSVAAWLKAHPDTQLVTDIKEHNVRALSVIASRYPELLNRIVPQIYHRREYSPVRSLGYSKIIYTLYRSTDSDADVVKFAKENTLFAVTMPILRLNRGLAKTLREKKVRVYTHTINDPKLAARLSRQELIDGIYTDFLSPTSGSSEQASAQE